MVAWALKDFAGETPRRSPRLLPDNGAEVAVNVDLNAGYLNGYAQPEFTTDLSERAAKWGYEAKKGYLVPPALDPITGFEILPEVWLPLPSPFSNAVPSPLANDTLHRTYWTNPYDGPAGGAWWATHAMIMDDALPWNMGFIPVGVSAAYPDGGDPASALDVTAEGGTPTTDVPYVTRSYVFTYLDEYGQESSPSSPSAEVDGAADGVWTISNFPQHPPGEMPGRRFPIPISMRLYRTVSGAVTGADFYYVADIPFGTVAFIDEISDTQVVVNNTLITASYAPPLPDIDGLIIFPGGMLVAFTGNTVHFSEPNLPNVWPAAYDQSVAWGIVGLAVWQQALIVLTRGYPYSGSGTTPAQVTFSQVNVPEPCISRGSIVTDLAGVYYASRNGLIMLNYFGMQNQTLSNMTAKIWMEEYHAPDIIACRHRAAYLAINGTGEGFIIDFSEQRMGIMHLSPFLNVDAVWNDVPTSNAYMCAGQKIYRWDSETAPLMNYRWLSKQFYLPSPTSLGACQISCDPAIENTAAPDNTALHLDSNQEIILPPGVNAIFRLFTGPNQTHPVHEEYITEPRMIFRLPSGFKTFLWQCEIVGNCPIHSIELASTMSELKQV
jgi:hypothetical protein